MAGMASLVTTSAFRPHRTAQLPRVGLINVIPASKRVQLRNGAKACDAATAGRPVTNTEFGATCRAMLASPLRHLQINGISSTSCPPEVYPPPLTKLTADGFHPATPPDQLKQVVDTLINSKEFPLVEIIFPAASAVKGVSMLSVVCRNRTTDPAAYEQMALAGAVMSTFPLGTGEHGIKCLDFTKALGNRKKQAIFEVGTHPRLKHNLTRASIDNLTEAQKDRFKVVATIRWEGCTDTDLLTMQPHKAFMHAYGKHLRTVFQERMAQASITDSQLGRLVELWNMESNDDIRVGEIVAATPYTPKGSPPDPWRVQLLLAHPEAVKYFLEAESITFETTTMGRWTVTFLSSSVPPEHLVIYKLKGSAADLQTQQAQTAFISEAAKGASLVYTSWFSGLPEYKQAATAAEAKRQEAAQKAQHDKLTPSRTAAYVQQVVDEANPYKLGLQYTNTTLVTEWGTPLHALSKESLRGITTVAIDAHDIRSAVLLVSGALKSSPAGVVCVYLHKSSRVKGCPAINTPGFLPADEEPLHQMHKATTLLVTAEKLLSDLYGSSESDAALFTTPFTMNSTWQKQLLDVMPAYLRPPAAKEQAAAPVTNLDSIFDLMFSDPAALEAAAAEEARKAKIADVTAAAAAAAAGLASTSTASTYSEVAQRPSSIDQPLGGRKGGGASQAGRGRARGARGAGKSSGRGNGNGAAGAAAAATTEPAAAAAAAAAQLQKQQQHQRQQSRDGRTSEMQLDRRTDKTWDHNMEPVGEAEGNK